MSLPIITYRTLEEKIYQTLIKVSNLDPSFIRNIDGIRGADLVKLINDYEAKAINTQDAFIVFEILENTSGNYITQDDDYTMSDLVNYKLFIRVYGDGCHELSQKIISKFKGETLRLSLYDDGIWVKGQDFPENAKEFINDTLWQRCDLSIYFMIHYQFDIYESGKEPEYFNEDTINDLVVRKI